MLEAFVKGITGGSSDIKGLSQSELRKYKSFLDTLTPKQRAAEKSKIGGMGNVARNKFVRGRISDFGSATTKEVKRQGGQNKQGALAKGGVAKKKMARGGTAKKKMMYGGKAKKK